MLSGLSQIVENLPAAKIVLVGDFMLDRYIFGSTERISPEAPIPILKYQREECRLGGAGFVLAALATLGGKVAAIGVAGDDATAGELLGQMQKYGADVSGMVPVAGRPTVSKTRYLGSSEDRAPHQMIRLDIEDSAPVDAATETLIIQRAIVALAGAAVMCLEDYNKGVLTPRVCREVIAAAGRHGVPVLIDAARLSDYGKYRGATLLKPNRPETERATGLPARTPAQCQLAAEKLLTLLDLQVVVITLNDLGSYLALRDGERELVAGRPREVADGTGAGDMVLAMLAMACAAGASWRDAVALANVAGGLEVQRLGCVPITREEIINDLMQEEHLAVGKHPSLEQLVGIVARHRAAGKKIVFTNGCFDLIHLGHVKYFQFARQQGDLLVVGVNTDAGIRRLKGPQRPILCEQDRLGVLEELASIDYLITYDEDTPLPLIEKIRPDVLVKGADYAKDEVVGAALVESYGGQVALAPLIDGKSASAVIAKILAAYGKQ